MQKFVRVATILMVAAVCAAPAHALPLTNEQGTIIDKYAPGLVITIDTARQNQTSEQGERPCTPRYRRVCEPVYKWKCRQPMYSQCRRTVVGERCRNVQVGTICDTFEQRDRRSPVRPR